MSFLTGQVFGVKGIQAKIRNNLILGGNKYIQKFMNSIWEWNSSLFDKELLLKITLYYLTTVITL